MKKLLLTFFTVLFYLTSSISWSETKRSLTFREFINNGEFIPIETSRLQLVVGNCNVVKNNKGIKIRYKEVELSINNNVFFDFNKHYILRNDYQSKNFSIPFYSISVWQWYKTVAIKTKNIEFLSNYKQVMRRRNMVVPDELIEDIILTGKFKIYLHQDARTTENKKYFGTVNIKNKESLKKCFI